MKKKFQKAFSLIEVSVVLLIIGIVIAGIIGGSKIINKARVVNAQLATKNSGIDQIPNMVAWYESTLKESLIGAVTYRPIPDDGDKISAWQDLNPTTIKNNFLQASSTYQPIYNTNIINGLPAIKFDGSDDYLQTSNLVGNNFTSFYVLKTSNAGLGDGTGLAWQGSFILNADVAFVRLDVIPLAISAGKLKIGIGNTESGAGGSASEEVVTTTTGTVNDNKPHVIVSSRNQFSGLRSIYIDGTLDVASSASDGGGNSIVGERSKSTVMTLGLSISSFNGYIGEVIIYNRILNQNERKVVESYLGKKWGVRVN